MGITDFLKKASGIVKVRGATAIGALRTTRVGRIAVGFARRTPAGLLITAATFAPKIVGFVKTAFARAVGFLGGTKVGAAVAGGITTGGIVGIVTGGAAGEPERPTFPGENGRAPTRDKPPKPPTKPKTKAEKEKAARRKKAAARRRAPKPRRGGAHKARIVRGLDIAHKKKKKGISLKTIRAAIASPRTPPQLKKGLRRLLRQKSAHKHKKKGRR